MHSIRKWVASGLAFALVCGGFLAFAPEADAGVRIIRRAPACTVPGYHPPRRHVHSYSYRQQHIFIGYDQFGHPVYEIRYVRVRTCGCG